MWVKKPIALIHVRKKKLIALLHVREMGIYAAGHEVFPPGWGRAVTG